MAITAEKLQIDVTANTDRATKALGDLEDTGKRIPAWAKSAAAALAGAFAVDKIVGGVKASISAASDLNETVSKTGQVFGDATSQVLDYVQQQADAFGLNKTVVADAASSFGLLANAAGLSKTASAGLSTQLAGLAADASSFYNVPIADALEKIRSGLVGEAEPLRAFGVMLNDAAVQQQAMTMGIWDGTGAMTEAQKVQARSAIIIAGLSTASGDLERTQAGVANRTRELQGRIQNLSADIGTYLLPAAAGMLSWANDAVKVIGDRLPGAMETASAVAKGVADAIAGNFDSPRLTAWSPPIVSALETIGSYARGLALDVSQ